ncbi:MAG: hypothetical protein HRT68_12260 [Flavobacteriaceae bacterium]|nr:hypothetical protein [Flavobacteriaceae bacterium]
MKNKLYILLFIFAFQSHAQRSDFNHIDFQKADSIALEYKNEKLDNLAQLSHKLTNNLETDVEKFRAIYLWVSTNIENDFRLYYKNKRKRKKYLNDTAKLQVWNQEFRNTIFKTLLKDKKTICTGYAYLVRELSKLANIECEIVQGYGRTGTTTKEDLALPNHSWNVVKLNGKWYLSDATWASGIQNPETFKFVFQYNDGFFLANPKMFSVNHYPVEKKWFLFDENQPTFDDFLNNPIVYRQAFNNIAELLTPQQMHSTIQKHEKINFQYQLQHSVKKEDIIFLVDNGTEQKKHQPFSISIKDQFLSLSYQFSGIGFYDVHLYIQEQLIATYTVKVKGKSL